MVRQAVRGVPTVELIPEILRQALTALPIAKRMRWGSGTAEFVRPVQWAVLLFGDELIPAEFLGCAPAARPVAIASITRDL